MRRTNIYRVKLDKTLTFQRHLESLRRKLILDVTLLKQLAGLSLRANTKILRSVTLALVQSTTQYCAAGWCRSNLTRLISKPINNVLRTVTGALRNNSTESLTALAGKHGRVVSASSSETSVWCSTPTSAIIYDAYTSIKEKKNKKNKKNRTSRSRQKKATIALFCRAQKPNLYCMMNSTLNIPNNKGILNQVNH